ncbi:MAG: acetylxylan esterase [Kiritimatiellae bacterium]|nr:acetylxylan esterase [Kiritimatiellia bacterium]
MKNVFWCAVGLLGALQALAGDPVGFRFETNHADALYKLGEEAVYTVTATNGAGERITSGVVHARLDNYGPKIQLERDVDLAKENPFVVRGKLDEPGFLRLSMSGKGIGKNNSRWGVGYEPTRIVAGGEVPADFDQFWADAQAQLEATVPLDPRMELDPEHSKGAFDYYRVSFATYGGTRVWGFLSIPKDRSKAPFPVTCEVCSAGEGKWTIAMPGRPDRIRFYFTVHTFEPPRTLAEVAPRHAQMREELKAKYGVGHYASAGIAVSREDYYFYRTILGINRAFNWLWQQDYVDRKHFDYAGGSQGGAFGWCLCGLNKHITSAVLRVPAMSDTRGFLAGRQSGWPGIIEAQPPALRDAAIKNAAYFDGASFATRITCPIRVTVGFIDNTCSPSSVYATFNRLVSKDKAILNAIGKGHGGQTREFDEIARQWQESR